MAIYVFRDGRMVDKATGEPMVEPGAPLAVPQICGDIAEYTSPVDGTLISSRRQERDHMAQHGMRHAADERKVGGFKNRRFVEKHGLWDRAEF